MYKMYKWPIHSPCFPGTFVKVQWVQICSGETCQLRGHTRCAGQGMSKLQAGPAMGLGYVGVGEGILWRWPPTETDRRMTNQMYYLFWGLLQLAKDTKMKQWSHQPPILQLIFADHSGWFEITKKRSGCHPPSPPIFWKLCDSLVGDLWCAGYCGCSLGRSGEGEGWSLGISWSLEPWSNSEAAGLWKTSWKLSERGRCDIV